MPRGDRSGPEGKGPKTGRGLGYCSGNDKPGYQTDEPRQGKARGLRNGRGFGPGRGFGVGRRNGPSRGLGRGLGYGYGYQEPIVVTKEEKRKMLEDEKKDLEEEIKLINEEIKELSK